MLKSIFIKNWKSFNTEGITVPLTNLNILIGGPGSGKSNFLSSVELIRRLTPVAVSDVSFNHSQRYDEAFPAMISGLTSSTELSFVFTERKRTKAHGVGLHVSDMNANGRNLDRFERHQFLCYSNFSDFACQSLRDEELTESLEDVAARKDKTAVKLLKELLKEAIDGFVKHDSMYIEDAYLEEQFVVMYLTVAGKKLNTRCLSQGVRNFVEICSGVRLSESKLISIENPDAGIHPDLFPKLAEQIKIASETKQVILTTNSREFLDCFNDRVGDICVVSNEGTGTKIERLDPVKMKVWTDKYNLSHLWASGHLGANRW